MVFVLALAASLANALTSVFQRMGVEQAPSSTTLRLSLLSYALRRRILAARVCADDRLLPVPGRRAPFRPPVPGSADPDNRAGVPRGDPGRLFPVLDRPPRMARLAGRHRRAGRASGISPIRSTAPCRRRCGSGSSSAGRAAAPSPSPSRSRCAARPGGGRLCSGPPRPLAFAFTAACTKAVAGFATSDRASLYRHWQTDALAFFGALAVFLAQNAFHACLYRRVPVDPRPGRPAGQHPDRIGLFGDNLQTSGAWAPSRRSRSWSPSSGRSRLPIYCW